jgi:hypothetical protein
MKKTLLAASLALIGAAQAAEITIYKQPSFSGGDQTFTRDMTTPAGHRRIRPVEEHRGALGPMAGVLAAQLPG